MNNTALSQHFPRGTEESREDAGIPAEIRTEHLPNTSLEHYEYHYTDQWFSCS
jgi:hypothetical protein